MKRYLLLYLHLASFTIKRDLEYRVGLISGAVSNFAWSNLSLLVVLVLGHTVGQFGGWNVDQMLLLVGFWMIVNGLAHVFFYGGIKRLIDDIHTGRLDKVLTLPVSSLFITSLRRPFLSSSMGIIEGSIVVFFAASKLQVVFGFNVVLMTVLLLVAAAVYWSLWVIAATMSIHFPMSDNLVYAVPELVDLSRFPDTAYPPALQNLFSSFVPILLMTSFPAQALQGLLPGERFAYALVVGGLAVLIARTFWNWSLRRYTSASS